MVSKQKIADLIEEHLAGSDKYLVEFSVSAANQIIVFIDGDHGVTISDCIALSRHIESNLDRETEDFELDVSSGGLDLGLRVKRQYLKNIGNDIDIKLNDNTKISGLLKAVEDDYITVEVAPSKKKRKQLAVVEELIKNINFNEIKESKVVVSFR